MRRRQRRYEKDKTFMDCFRLVKQLRDEYGWPKDKVFSYIPRCKVEGIFYKNLADFSRTIGMTTSVFNTYKSKHRCKNIIETFQKMQKDCVPAYYHTLRLEDAVNYLERKKPYVPCYALRSVMDYRNSSNPVEKANDLIVAGRQKHNGMSWSYTGSGSLAILSALLYNGELNSWLANHQIPFTVPDNLPLQEAA